MTLSELIKRVYYFPDSYMHFNVEFNYGIRRRKGVLVFEFKLSTKLTPKEDIIKELESTYMYRGFDKECALKRKVEFICCDEYGINYGDNEKSLIKENPDSLTLQLVLLYY